MSVGLDWYKREPVAYLGDVQGLTSKQHAVYSVVLDLIYVHGGEIRNDPKWISGWISDMGAAAVRKALKDLDANPRVTITVSEDTISQKRAKTEVKLKRNQSETNSVSGKKGGEKSAKTRAAASKNKEIGEANASSETQAEKRREDKREETNVSSSARASSGHGFSAFWDTFPHRNGKKTKRAKCEAAFAKAVKSGTEAQAIIQAAGAYRDDPDVLRGYGRAAETWLNQRGWEDEASQRQPNFHDRVSASLNGEDHDKFRNATEDHHWKAERLPPAIPRTGATGRSGEADPPQGDGGGHQSPYLDVIRPRRFGGSG